MKNETPETDALIGTFETHEGKVAFGIKEIEALIDKASNGVENER